MVVFKEFYLLVEGHVVPLEVGDVTAVTATLGGKEEGGGGMRRREEEEEEEEEEDGERGEGPFQVSCCLRWWWL